ncbi:RloB family protein [Sporomusa sphaeroides]|uniref:RloB family protein n=1 Tax=Sporomusa sphaeroides TaxID=47679 RepID=UPI0031594A70
MARITESPRRRNTRKVGITVLIICEGEKTERIYFGNYKKRGTGIKVEIPNSSNTDPINLLRYAEMKADDLGINKDNGSVWLVFDCDANKNRNLARVKKEADERNIQIIYSNPSFEIWYLLHYVYSTASLTNPQLETELKKYIPNYSKSKCFFQKLKQNQQNAIANAKRLQKYHSQQGNNLISRESNPFSLAFILINYLNNLIQI